MSELPDEFNFSQFSSKETAPHDQLSNETQEIRDQAELKKALEELLEKITAAVSQLRKELPDHKQFLIRDMPSHESENGKQRMLPHREIQITIANDGMLKIDCKGKNVMAGNTLAQHFSLDVTVPSTPEPILKGNLVVGDNQQREESETVLNLLGAFTSAHFSADRNNKLVFLENALRPLTFASTQTFSEFAQDFYTLLSGVQDLEIPLSEKDEANIVKHLEGKNELIARKVPQISGGLMYLGEDKEPPEAKMSKWN